MSTTPTAATSVPRYDIDPAHSGAQFKVRHLMISNVKGHFTAVKGTVDYDRANPSATRIDVSIDVNSIDTRDAQRDGHLKSADFFDVEKYPEITFKSTEVVATSEGFEVVGDLTIHGVTNQVALDVEDVTPEAKDPWGNVRVGATASTTINRKDFGLTWNTALETGGVLVGDDVKIEIDVEMVRKAQ
jgi:polyisoprenoid-binding protein YceI